MNLLLDTHILLWWQQNNPLLSASARGLIADANNSIFVSSISLWEIAIKTALGKLEVEFDELLRAIEDDGFEVLDFSKEHARGVLELHVHHNDPFDRALIAQSQRQSMTLVTHDDQLAVYGGFVRLV